MIEAVLVLGVLNVVIGLVSIWQRHQALTGDNRQYGVVGGGGADGADVVMTMLPRVPGT